jgi:hypothetical protein
MEDGCIANYFLDHLLLCDAAAAAVWPPAPPLSVGYGVLDKLQRSRTHARSRSGPWSRREELREPLTCASRVVRLIKSHATRHASKEGAHRRQNGPRVYSIFFPSKVEGSTAALLCFLFYILKTCHVTYLHNRISTTGSFCTCRKGLRAGAGPAASEIRKYERDPGLFSMVTENSGIAHLPF